MKINIEELIGAHIFDGATDYRIESYSYPNIYAKELEYNKELEEFRETGKTSH